MRFINYFGLILLEGFYLLQVESQELENEIEDEIRAEGYPPEIHSVTTEDGYILTIFRIRGSRRSTPVYMMHGLLETGADWLALGKHKSLAYFLHDRGYDVWLGNARGNLFSKKHVNFTTDDAQFWDFSFTEVGIYDLPAVIDYITTLTRKKLFYIGHSMGGTFMSIMGIERPDVARKVKAMIGLAPGTYCQPTSLPLVALSPVSKQFYEVTKALHIYEFFHHDRFTDVFSKYVCGSRLLSSICNILSFLTAGYSPEHLDFSVQKRFTKYFPGGTSIKLYTHFLQQIDRKTKLNKFNYGEEKNLQIYGSALPPAYDLSKMRIPTAVFWAQNDIIVLPQSIKDSYRDTPVKLGIFQVPDKTFNHFDYLTAKDADQLVYPTVLKIMTDFDNQ